MNSLLFCSASVHVTGECSETRNSCFMTCHDGDALMLYLNF